MACWTRSRPLSFAAVERVVGRSKGVLDGLTLDVAGEADAERRLLVALRPGRLEATEHGGGLDQVTAGKDQEELVAAVPDHGIAAVDVLPEVVGEAPQDAIAARVPEPACRPR